MKNFGSVCFLLLTGLLTHRHSVSAAENFALALRVIPHVTVVGAATSGVMANVYGDRLPNCWRVHVPYDLFTDYTGFCWEGIGIPPDIRQTNSKTDIENDHDRVLELAMLLIETGDLKPQDESGSLKNLRDSAVALLRDRIDQEGIEAALATYNKAKTDVPESYFFDPEELVQLSSELLEAGKPQTALRILQTGVQDFPDVYWMHESLADAYFMLGQEGKAKAEYEKVLETNRRSFPWEKEAYTVAEKIVNDVKVLNKILERRLQTQGAEAAVQVIVQIRSEQPDNVYVEERAMNRLGYRLLRAQNVDAAIDVFKINAEENPNSWNVWDSLAEGYMTKGDKEQAIKYYEKSIMLNPYNQKGKDMLKQLKGK